MQANSYLKAGGSKSYQIRLFVPLYFGLNSENFQLANSLGKIYPNTGFVVSLTVNRSSQRVIEITNTETGTLNVRANPGGNSEVIQKVNPGQRFFVLDNSNGWTKLNLGNGKNGWVLSKYVKTV
jgi:SH3-like domain-containing protein